MLPFSVVLLQQIHCYAILLLRYYGNVTTQCHATVTHVTMEMHQAHCYTTVTITLL
jgi:hypothetical protein